MAVFLGGYSPFENIEHKILPILSLGLPMSNPYGKVVT